MSKNDSVVLRVKDCYVIDDCCQLMMPYLDIVTVISKDGVLFYDDKSCNKTYINKYVDDLRKDGLPYANIPTHVSSDYGVVMDYANVLLDYIEEMGYDLKGMGFLTDYVGSADDGVERNDEGKINEAKSDFITAYLVSDNYVYTLKNDNIVTVGENKRMACKSCSRNNYWSFKVL